MDEYGHVVRRARADRNRIENMCGGWLDGAWDEGDPWVSAEVGDDYLEGAARGPPYILEE